MKKLLKTEKYLKESAWVEILCSEGKLAKAIERAEKNIKAAVEAGKLDEQSNAYDYFKGVVAAYLGTGFMSHPILEWQIDLIKENISHFCEAQIDYSPLSYQEREEQKRQMKQSLEMYIQGVKDGNRFGK